MINFLTKNTKEFGMDFIDKIKIKLWGKNPAVLGLRGSGKSTLLHFIQTEETISYYEPTNSELITRKTMKFNTKSPIKLTKSVKDLGGSKDFHPRWKEQIQKSQLIIYIIDSEQWLSDIQEDVQKQISYDIEIISEALNSKKGIFSTIILINKFDKIKIKYDYPDHDLKTNLAKFNFIEGCRLKLSKPTRPCNIVIGNLNTYKDALSTVNNLAEVA